MAQVGGGGGEQNALRGLGGHAGPSKALQDEVKSGKHLLEGGSFASFDSGAYAGRPDAHIIQVGHAHLPCQALQCRVHEATHVRGSRLNSKGEVIPLVFLSMGNKSGASLVRLLDRQSPETRGQVDGGQEEGVLCASARGEAVYGFVATRDGGV